jgi:hypothetical protein
MCLAANGSRYPLGVGEWTRPRNGIPPKQENAQKTRRVPPVGCTLHAVLGMDLETLLSNFIRAWTLEYQACRFRQRRELHP